MKKLQAFIFLWVGLLCCGQKVLNSPPSPNTEVSDPVSIRLLPGFSFSSSQGSFRAYIGGASPSNPVSPVFNGQNSDLSGVNQNYVYSRTYLEPKTSSDPYARQIQSIRFFDGLGRPKQDIAIHASPTGNDLVTDIPYDNFGRQVKDWLPVPMTSQNGNIQTPPLTSDYYKTASGSVDAIIYGEKNIENSPLDRILSYTSPGSDWSGKQVNYNYQANEANEVYRFTTTTSWNDGAGVSVLNFTGGTYLASSLYKTVTTDEDGNKVTTFTNGQDQTLLVRKNDGANNLDTYYVYNEYNQLAFIVPPLAVHKTITPTLLDELIYQYRYDGWNRLVEKKDPGKDWEYMVYDKADRLIMTQDANMRSQKKWFFTKYDIFSRIAYTGLLSSLEGRSAQQAAINTGSGEERSSSGFTDMAGSKIEYTADKTYPQSNMTVLAVNYYDTYPSGSPQNSLGVTTKSMLLASFVKNIEDNGWTKNYNWYDEKGRPVAAESDNHLGGYTKTESILAFSGVPTHTTLRHKKDPNSPEVTISESFAYDHQNRLTKHTHRINGGAEETLAEYIYNELGQLQSKNVGNGMQSLAYRYNTQGALTHLNDPNNLNNKLFGFELKYTAPQNTPPLYSGNIAEIDWATQSDGLLKRYSYFYDKTKRLISGVYREPNTTNPDASYFNESTSYDLNGNILHLDRFKQQQNSTTAEHIDALAYTYDNGNTSNRLIRVNDASGNSTGYPVGGNTFTYDANGNMASQPDKEINSIVYNFLDLPSQIIQNTGNTTYLYRADGAKQRKTYGNTVTDYIDGFQYINGVLQFVHTDEGYYDFVQNKYIYNYTDHLGNIRLSYAKGNSGGAEVLEENNYYPFGLKYEGYAGLANPNYKYGFVGNELQENGMQDMNARFYMPELGRFMQHDPLSSLSLDPYGYAFNNPISFRDSTGLFGEGPKCPPDCFGSSNSPIQLPVLGIPPPPGGSSNYYTWWEIENYYHISGGDNSGYGSSYYGSGDSNKKRESSEDRKPTQIPTVYLKGKKKSNWTDVNPWPIALATSGTLLADDATGVGVADDVAIPIVIAGAAAYYLATKMAKEIEKIEKRNLKPKGFLYELRATKNGLYPNFNTGGTTHLKVGDVWKYGETIQGEGRYPDTKIDPDVMGLKMYPIYYGNQMEIKIQEKIMIYGYYFQHGHRPPGNSIFR